MEILTFAAGLIVGAFSVSVDLAGVPAAQLRLDGVPVCELAATSTTCRIDIGPELAVHELQLVRLDAQGGVAERVSRWLNRPGSAEAEVRIATSCAEPPLLCTAKFTWIHPDGASPSSWSVLLDGKPLSSELGKPFSFAPRSTRGQALTVEAGFPDGRRASAMRILGGDRTDDSGIALQAVPIEVTQAKVSLDSAELSRRLGGLHVRAVERGESELVFVVDPVATARLAEFRRAALVGAFPGISMTRLRSALAQPGALRFVHPETSGVRFARAAPAATGTARADALLKGDPSFLSGRLRLADAVAAAGLLAGGGQRRRAVVLILGSGRPDLSQFRAPQVQRYLSDLLVPLHVIRLASDVAAPLTSAEDEWGKGARVGTESELRDALNRVNEALERQRIVWLDGDRSPAGLHLQGDEGPRLAGRVAPSRP